MDDPIHNVVFCTGLRDPIHIKGRHKGRRKPCWLETTTRRFFPNAGSECSGSCILGPNTIFLKSEESWDQRSRCARTDVTKKKSFLGVWLLKGLMCETCEKI